MSDNPAALKKESFPRLAVLTGWDENDTLAEGRDESVLVEGNNDMTRFVVESRFTWLRFHITPSYYAQPKRYNMKNRNLLCNIVSDPDQNPRVLKVIERVVKDSGLPVLNAPEKVWNTTRDGSAALLADVPGLVTPKVLRVKSPSQRQLRKRMEETGFRFPALVREPGVHNGEFVGLFKKPEDLRPVFAKRHSEYILTEFVDFASADGLYRKDRIFFIGDAIFPRHRITSNVWNLHADDKQTLMPENENLVEEERQMVTGGFDGLHPTTQAVFREVKARIGLDYFGLDCNVRPDGEVILFEANATTNFFPLGGSDVSAYLRDILYEPTVAAFERMVEKLAGPMPETKAAS